MNRYSQLKKYLTSRAVLAPWTLDGDRDGGGAAAIVIPALAESTSLPATLKSIAVNDPRLLSRTLVIVVVNNRSDASDEVRRDNEHTLDWLASRPFPGLRLVWINAAAAGLELHAGQGVGLARKIGFDAALQRLDWNSVPILISLDADTLVEPHYLAAVFRHFAAATATGAVIPFRHQQGIDLLQEEAIRAYELYLRSYQFGLQQAGSHYAYHSIGSAFACRAQGYIEAGGMNRRLAGEDFYFLQQLHKVGGISLLRGTVVCPAARSSARVPFGTGRIVERHQQGTRPGYQFIDQHSFCLLRQWLREVEGASAASAAVLLGRARQLSTVLAEFLEERNFSVIWGRLQDNYRHEQQRISAFHHWFDALRTRQLLTRLSGVTVEPVALVAELLEWGGYPGRLTRSEQLALLERAQGAGTASAPQGFNGL